MGRTLGLVLSALMVLMGVVFTFQGLGYIKGSAMTGVELLGRSWVRPSPGSASPWRSSPTCGVTDPRGPAPTRRRAPPAGCGPADRAAPVRR